MAENSHIEWTHHTFNPWVGCTKVSAACDFCFAKAWEKRDLHGLDPRSGPHAPRTSTLKAIWSNPLNWQKAEKAAGEQKRVFCSSLANVFDNHKSIQSGWRDDLWALIRKRPDLDWLMLTKRPQTVARLHPDDLDDGYQNVRLNATVENQKAADRLSVLTELPAAVRFLSVKPLLGGTDLGSIIDKIDWTITGGENCENYRPVNPDWLRYLCDQCLKAGVPFLCKQWESAIRKVIDAKRHALDGVVHNGYPAAQLLAV